MKREGEKPVLSVRIEEEFSDYLKKQKDIYAATFGIKYLGSSKFKRCVIRKGSGIIDEEIFHKFMDKVISTNKEFFKRGFGGLGCGKTAISIMIYESMRQEYKNLFKTSKNKNDPS